MPKIEEEIERIERERAALAKELKRLKEKARREAKHDNDRRALLVGRLVLKEAAKTPDVQALVSRLIAADVAGVRDRELFGLPPLPEAPQTAPHPVPQSPEAPPP